MDEKPRTTKKTWRDLAGALDDPDSPGDIAERHDYYLGLADSQDYDEGLLEDYTDERVKEFLEEDQMTEDEVQRVRAKLGG